MSPWRTLLTAFGLSLLTTAVCLAVYCCCIADYFPAFFPEDHTAAIAAAAKNHGLDEALVRAVVRKESRFRSRTVGKKGEIGLMQLLPHGAVDEWARVHKRSAPSRRELFSPVVNLDIGCWYLAVTLDRWRHYRHGIELALADYNAGIRHARRWAPKDPAGDVVSRIDWPGTRQYVTDIMKFRVQEQSFLEKKALP